MLSLLQLPPQLDRDAVMILHMGGTFGDKAATLDRFRENYNTLSASVKQRLVLENDDVSWSVHDLLPICEELNIPLCLDFHHNNIIFDESQIREGTHDIMELYPRIKLTWDRKQIRQKMHYSEPTPDAITGRQRRKHNPRPATLPPCPNDMDLMIEAKDKEQAVFELMRTFKLPGWDTFNNLIPYERSDDNKPIPKKAKRKKTKKQIAAEIEEYGKELSSEEEEVGELISDDQVGMGGKENRVYWPVGLEEWLRPKKREVKKKGVEDEDEMFKNPTPANFAARKAIGAWNKASLTNDAKEKLREANTVVDVQRIMEEHREASFAGDEISKPLKRTKALNKTKPTKRKAKYAEPTSDGSLRDEEDDLSMPDLSAADEHIPSTRENMRPSRKSGRVKMKNSSYIEADGYASQDESMDA
jgi:UV DNA damage endonuclease